MADMPPDVLTPSQVAAQFAVSVATVNRWADEGRLAGFRTPTGRWRFRRTDIEKLGAAGGQRASA